jgi:hypothetical protein
VTLHDGHIVIDCLGIIHKDYSMHVLEQTMNKDLLLDLFCNFYAGQQIIVKFPDGENPRLSGFIDFMKFICETCHIPEHKILFEIETLNKQPVSIFPQQVVLPRIFNATGDHIPEITNRNLDSAKFVGTLIGRITTPRLRLAYAVDQNWPGDNFMTYQGEIAHTHQIHSELIELYREELIWVKNKIFDQDLRSDNILGSVYWDQSLASYANIWNRFQIEIVCETDAWGNGWFTEKTARCLATGKPFVLLAGAGALGTLRSQGFKTFGDIIDESYDICPTPARRIAQIIESLKTLYEHPERSALLKLMNQRAAENVILYQQFTNQHRQKSFPLMESAPIPEPAQQYIQESPPLMESEPIPEPVQQYIQENYSNLSPELIPLH